MNNASTVKYSTAQCVTLDQSQIMFTQNTQKTLHIFMDKNGILVFSLLPQ